MSTLLRQQQALQQLEGQSPLPHLFMRTVIVSLQTHPKLMGAVLGILTGMVNRQVWDGPHWKGFLLAVAKAAPHSYDVLLQMPAAALDAALAALPSEHWPRLAARAAGRGGARVPIFQPVRDVVAKYADRAQQELRAKLEAAEAARKRREAKAAKAAAEGEEEGGEEGGADEGGEGGDADGGDADADAAAAAGEEAPPAATAAGAGGGGGDDEDWTLADDEDE